MTYFFIRHSERSEESHRRTDGYMYFFTLVVGYFACAQYDVFFIPYRHFVPLPPKEEAKTHVILNDSEESHRRTDGYIFLALVVGYFADAQYDVLFFTCHCERSAAISREGEDLRSISSALFRWDISLALNMT